MGLKKTFFYQNMSLFCWVNSILRPLMCLPQVSLRSASFDLYSNYFTNSLQLRHSLYRIKKNTIYSRHIAKYAISVAMAANPFWHSKPKRPKSTSRARSSKTPSEMPRKSKERPTSTVVSLGHATYLGGCPNFVPSESSTGRRMGLKWDTIGRATDWTNYRAGDEFF